MPRKTLGEFAKQEIRDAMRGLTGTPAKQEAVRLATNHLVAWQHIYRMTADLRDTTRKPRSDKGKRIFQLEPGTDVWYAAQLVVAGKCDPDQAIETCRTRGLENLPTLEYFRQMLAEKGLGKKARRNPKAAYRRWEAERPLQIVQIDVTALKVRWQDEKTRRILRIDGVDKNHPQMDPTKIRVWQILLTDDYSRRKVLRYFVARAITSDEMVRFMAYAYDLIGVPETVYTDKGGEFKGRHTQAAKILNSLPTITETGGYRHLPHAANNAKATGKVENGHQWAEKMDRFVGLAVTEGQIVTIESLNLFAERVCDHYNNRVHRTTGETPMTRWHGTRIIVRRLPGEIIESALLSDEFPCVLDPSMTVAYKGTTYKVPGVHPFVDFVGKTVKIVVPPNIDVILLTLPNSKGKFEPDHGGEFEIEKILATADKAGEFKSVAESTPQALTRALKEARKLEVKAIKEQSKLTGQIAPVPHLNVLIEQPVSNIAHFPQAETIITVEEIAAVTPIATTLYTGREIGYWEAVGMFADRFADVVEAKAFFEASLFPNTEGRYPESEVEQAITDRDKPAFISGLRLAG